MADGGERNRHREMEAQVGSGELYEAQVRRQQDLMKRQLIGQIVVRPEDRDWEVSRQGRLRHYLLPSVYTNTASHDWFVFVNDVRKHSGKHRHQGSVIIYVLEGKGYSIVNGERVDWEDGDLVLLPIRPGGVEHQHFNIEPGTPCKWLAFLYLPFWDWVASEITQVENSPEYSL